jgi:hypothetical protein
VGDFVAIGKSKFATPAGSSELRDHERDAERPGDLIDLVA